MTPVLYVLVLVALGLIFGGLGAAAYAGLWRSWRGRIVDHFVFGWFWLGLTLLSMALAASFVRTPVFGLSFVFAFCAVVTGSLGFWVILMGLPRWLRPRWYRVAQER
ncbi:hypothetical protein GCM10017714_13480 [Curtobacterium pusillum]|uniref:FtsH-binding integral membrane protein n=1 Tax=Curtobacterium pusillum TaxID=69373 RepID=A0AAW3T3V2_9MICO|nr:hypothetical protein [Curtobacterium pusillum]MBA8989901.1 FtsH-binding integral membrane protein [Curtobacterium pusillum]NUU13114.1 hypothetical protein [Curtobacterium pusillum]GLK30609.1 hypothetical protein GCM10017610_08940 [Curtobacterium pusillum]